MKKRLMAALMASAMAATMLLTGCGSGSGSGGDSAESGSSSSGDTIKVAFVNQTDADDCCFAATQNFKSYVESDEFKEKVGGKNVEVYTADSNLDIAKQTDNVENLITKGVEAMFIIGVDTAGNTTAVNACNSADIPVFMVGTEADGGDWKFIGFKEYDIGYQQGEYLGKTAPQGAKVCYLTGTAGREASVDQEKGFRDALEKSGRTDIELLSVQPGEWTAEKAMRVTEDWIQVYGDQMNYIVSMDGKMASGAAEALKGAGMADKVSIIGVYSMGTWNSDLIKDGYMEFAVFKDWPSIGNLCGDVLAKVLNGETVDDQTYYDMMDITKDTYSDFFDA